MPEMAVKKAAYADLQDIPENMTGEIINGEIVLTPRPSRQHAVTASRVGGVIVPPYDFGRSGGPGGWILLMEPEIGLGQHILVPDLAGWREERYPEEEPHNWISVPPDWICEILSPATRRRDRMGKMPIYAQYQVPYLWLIDPIDKTLEVFRLKDSEWIVAGLYEGCAGIRAVPFVEIEIYLSDLWREGRRGQSQEEPRRE